MTKAYRVVVSLTLSLPFITTVDVEDRELLEEAVWASAEEHIADVRYGWELVVLEDVVIEDVEGVDG